MSRGYSLGLAKAISERPRPMKELPGEKPPPFQVPGNLVLSLQLEKQPKTLFLANQMANVRKPDILRRLLALRHSLHSLAKQTHNMLTLADIDAKTAELAAIIHDLRRVREAAATADSIQLLLPSDQDVKHDRLDAVLDSIWILLFDLWGGVACISDSLYRTYVDLVVVARRAEAIKSRGAWCSAEVVELQNQLHELEERVISQKGWFLPSKHFSTDTLHGKLSLSSNDSSSRPGPTSQQVSSDWDYYNVCLYEDLLGQQKNTDIPFGQAVMSHILHRAHRTISYLQKDEEQMVDDLKLLANELQVINSSAYTMSTLSPSQLPLSSHCQTLKHFSLILGTIDSSRGLNGEFPTASTSIENDNSKLVPGNATCSGLLLSSFYYIFKVMHITAPPNRVPPVHFHSLYTQKYKTLLSIYDTLFDSSVSRAAPSQSLIISLTSVAQSLFPRPPPQDLPQYMEIYSLLLRCEMLAAKHIDKSSSKSAHVIQNHLSEHLLPIYESLLSFQTTFMSFRSRAHHVSSSPLDKETVYKYISEFDRLFRQPRVAGLFPHSSDDISLSRKEISGHQLDLCWDERGELEMEIWLKPLYTSRASKDGLQSVDLGEGKHVLISCEGQAVLAEAVCVCEGMIWDLVRAYDQV